ncbi:fused indole-3-glycerolphosphate synthetase/N-(5-phosphoribosyl)anthranilate isomerase [Haemophilus influenzae]|uniref:indole-3-glycerol-phosphate synthase n=1 Tax=Haemophilus influenzae TaxID=727 RepID=A0A2X1QKT5_HAEIF|nr:fused indole-3-glycerolphosphate synthetase/N-(5-phosphoribosyl)anthranilate isomerase [Haemophilus influenzae]
MECKKASPSKGLIRAEFNLEEIANAYKHDASAVSVLTDEKYFQGNFEFLPLVRGIVSQLYFAKIFMISEYQVYLARYYQADAILLMLSSSTMRLIVCWQSLHILLVWVY